MRPATQNKRDAIEAQKKMDHALRLLNSAWHLIEGIKNRESEQHASTGRTDSSQAKRRKRAKR